MVNVILFIMDHRDMKVEMWESVIDVLIVGSLRFLFPVVFDHSREEPNKKEIRTLQLSTEQRYWDRKHPGGARKEVHSRSVFVF